VLACAAIVVLDWAQPLVHEWVPKHVGALLGGAVYLAGAVGIARGARAFALVVALMPILPLGTLALWGIGVALPVTPDLPMVVVLSVQLVAALAAGRWWLDTRAATGDQRREGRTT